ncbi:hypothetical protein [Halalkalibacter alkalisediminis]|uniref:N-acetyltransferase domain-containing protein n=1 Tax=Halalkalibacter alkalisediminis TaxID=935616 RepID=A0ABV6NAI7_9BACI
MMVGPDYQKLGIGSYILKTLIGNFKQSGMNGINYLVQKEK